MKAKLLLISALILGLSNAAVAQSEKKGASQKKPQASPVGAGIGRDTAAGVEGRYAKPEKHKCPVCGKEFTGHGTCGSTAAGSTCVCSPGCLDRARALATDAYRDKKAKEARQKAERKKAREQGLQYQSPEAKKPL